MKHDFHELRLEQVTRRFAGSGGHVFNALSELTMTIHRGEFIALLGPSGCGKSTALNCIAGLLPLSGGTIRLDDERIDTLPPERRGFGMVFQNYALFPHMSVVKNIGFGLRMRGVAASDIAPRVAIARAIVIEPPLILMDEPLSNLDAKLRLETRSEIRRIHRELGRATIYVTHDQDEALSLADRIVVMKDGVVQQIASPQEVYAQPANLHVARFMGYRNVVDLPIREERGDRVVLEAPDLRLTGVRKLPLDGKRASVAIRPDEMSIATGPAAENIVSGRVDNVEYGGRDSLIDIVTSGGTRLHVRAPGNVALGSELHLHVPPERVLVYPYDGSGP